MDAGHLELESKPVNLSEIIEEWLDDLGALPDSPDVKIERDPLMTCHLRQRGLEKWRD